ncbi:hypothetical protein NUW58_g3386 [Xylaria curta]|uniref:Uncharacterized protein n=1 Tax=Xylaria curta TaxID=42375 RepID=A0ACC1PDW2_9PEZI|nr:hypothetical protein NUW58_g3386 [Xylaria curta]
MNTSSSTDPDPSQGRVIPSNEMEGASTGDDFGPSVEACIWSLAVLAAGWLALRLYLKFRKHRGLWWDDHFLIMVTVFLSNTSTSVAISLGWGKQPYDIPPKHWPGILLALIISGMFSILAAAISKTSFALTLLRISNGWVKCVIWFSIVTVNVILSLSVIFNWVQCTPVEKNFNPIVPGRSPDSLFLLCASYQRLEFQRGAYPTRPTLTTSSNTKGFLPQIGSANSRFANRLMLAKGNPHRIQRLCCSVLRSRGHFISASTLESYLEYGDEAGTISLVKIYALTGTFQADLTQFN